MNIDGYEVMRRDRNRNGGGVALYIRSSINYRTRLNLMLGNLETITVEVQKPRAKAFLIQTWYRSPNALNEVFDEFEKCIQKMVLKIKKSYALVPANNVISNKKIT